MIIGIDAHNVRGNGGSLIHLKELLSNSSQKDHEFKKIIVWGNSDTLSKMPKRDFIEYIILPNRNSIASLIWQKYSFENEAKELKCNILFFPGGIYLGKFKPVIALSQSPFPFDYNVWRIYFPTFQVINFLVKQKLMIHTFNKSNGVIFVSDAMKKMVEKFTKKIPNSIVIHHGVSEKFNIRVKTQKIENRIIKLLIVSSHALHKNLIPLVTIISEINQKNIKVELTIVGPQTKYGSSKLYEEIKKIDPSSDFIKIITNAIYEELPQYYNNSDIFIATSLCESFGLPFKEALVNQIPIIYQKLDPFNEIIKDFKPITTIIEYSNINRDFKTKLRKLISIRMDNENAKIDSRHFWKRCTDESFNYFNNVVSKVI